MDCQNCKYLKEFIINPLREKIKDLKKEIEDNKKEFLADLDGYFLKYHIDARNKYIVELKKKWEAKLTSSPGGKF